MAFKIKSAKIFFFFFGIKEHTVMLLVVLPCWSTHWAATGRQQEEETRLCHNQILQVDNRLGQQRSRQEGWLPITHSKRTRGATASTPNQAGVHLGFPCKLG